MINRLSDQQISTVFSKALQMRNLLDHDDTSIMFYDLSFLNKRVSNLIELFPRETLHAIAIKANPLQGIIRRIKALGVGMEAASLPEIHIAIDADFPSDKVVFDSPIKTREELEYALSLGIHINADSLSEIERIELLMQDRQPKGTIGVRINPQVGTGRIASTSVAGDYSKFGIPLNEQREELEACFIKHDWLSGVHLHIGSQGCTVEMLLKGVEKVLGFVNEVNDSLQARGMYRRITIFDLGGGLPVSYHRDQQPTSMSQYAEALNTRFPKLFSQEFKLMTEFGRYIYANTGWVASRVEYIKRSTTINTAMIHVGADLLLRECYNPQDWHHEISVTDHTGKMKSGLDDTKYNIAGPLCFAGDVIAREIDLPKLEVGDYIIIQDTGAYTLSMWSRYNSRQIPKVVGYHEDGTKFEILKERESIGDVLRFWA